MNISMTRVLSQQTPLTFTASVVAASQWPDSLADAQARLDASQFHDKAKNAQGFARPI